MNKKHMKFDVVIMNPPYQDKTAKSSKKMWDRFLSKAIDLCKEEGYVASISPFSWASASNPIFSVFRQNQTLYVNLDGKKYFPSVGTTISWYILRKRRREFKKTVITSNEASININLNDVDFLPITVNQITINILKKILSKEPKLKIQYDYYCEQRKPTISQERSMKFKYPIKHTASQTLYSNVPHPNMSIKKVIFPISSSMQAEYDGKGEYGCSQHYAWIKVKSQEEATRIIAYLHSDIISWLRKNTQWTASWSRPILKLIPNIPNDCNDLHSYFGLTTEEIIYIRELI